MVAHGGSTAGLNLGDKHFSVTSSSPAFKVKSCKFCNTRQHLRTRKIVSKINKKQNANQNDRGVQNNEIACVASALKFVRLSPHNHGCYTGYAREILNFCLRSMVYLKNKRDDYLTILIKSGNLSQVIRVKTICEQGITLIWKTEHTSGKFLNMPPATNEFA